MNKILNYEGFEENLTTFRQLGDGVQYVFKFENDYGASVVKRSGSYGYDRDLWELAVIRFRGEGYWYLVYETPITDDVVGFATDDKIRKLLGKIKNLTKVS